MKKTALQVLEDYFQKAFEDGKNVYVEITLPQFTESEFIINKNKSILEKLNYYKENFTDELINKTNSEVEIIAFGTINPANMPKGLEI
ncbi:MULTISPECIES: hypothetical protein [Beduini]|uniref:hypothetical protein n=1 Tax=Beduini TaxID=1922299 RepID=UPI00059AAD71|nr:hypothetical protein [Beduini massiliensis]